MELLAENINFTVVATFAIPFIIQALKWLLERFKIKIRSKVLVGMVCAVVGVTYALVTRYVSWETLVVISEVVGVSFVLSQKLYQSFEKKEKV